MGSSRGMETWLFLRGNTQVHLWERRYIKKLQHPDPHNVKRQTRIRFKVMRIRNLIESRKENLVNEKRGGDYDRRSVSWNRNYFLLFRFRLLKSYGSDF
jgi:hypothetical protein